MDSCVLTQLYKPRSSFVKPHVEAPRQVIGFNLLPKEETIEVPNGGLDNNSLPNSEIIKRETNEGSPSPKGASSPRSALQQLLLSQSQPATSSASANHNSTHALLKPQPPRSPQSSNNNLTGRLLTPAPSASPSPPANQRSTGSIFKSVDQTQCASSPAPSPSAGNRSLTIRREPDKGRSHTVVQQNHEMKGRLTGMIKEISNEQYSCAGRSQKSSWKEVQRIDEHHACVGLKSKRSSWKEVGNNPESKKSSLFMFVVSSSPAAEYHQHHRAHLFTEKDMDFLNSCHLCRRFLGQGQDVFMYSGDKAFCSMECRYQQIVIDERNERRAPPVIRSGASQIMYNQSTTTTTTTTATATTSATHHPIMINKPKYFINNTAAAA